MSVQASPSVALIPARPVPLPASVSSSTSEAFVSNVPGEGGPEAAAPPESPRPDVRGPEPAPVSRILDSLSQAGSGDRREAQPDPSARTRRKRLRSWELKGLEERSRRGSLGGERWAGTSGKMKAARCAQR